MLDGERYTKSYRVPGIQYPMLKVAQARCHNKVSNLADTTGVTVQGRDVSGLFDLS